MTKTNRVLRWQIEAESAASRYAGMGMGPEHLLAIVARESGGDPDAVSATGYRGLCQIGAAVTSDWAAAQGIGSPWPDVHDPGLNLTIGAWFLGWCHRFARQLTVAQSDRWGWAMATYAWGPGNVRKAAQRVTQIIGRAPSLADMETHDPDAGGGHVRPWHRGRVYLSDVAVWRARIDGAASPGTVGEVAVDALTILILSAAVAGAAVLAWGLLR